MKRVRRWLIKSLTTLSFVLCIAMISLAIRSFFYCDEFTFTSLKRTTRLVAASWKGNFLLEHHGGFVRQTRTNESKPGKIDVGFFASQYPLFPIDVSYRRYDRQRWLWSSLTFFYYSNMTTPLPLGLAKAPVGFDLQISLAKNWWFSTPDWILIALTAILPVRWAFVSIRQRKRKLIGGCKVCGYDLRATPDRCPECGTVQ
jgi:hypothetical protein